MILIILSLVAAVSFAQHTEIYAINGKKEGEGMALDGQHFNRYSLANVLQGGKIIQITNRNMQQMIDFKPAVVNLSNTRFASLNLSGDWPAKLSQDTATRLAFRKYSFARVFAPIVFDSIKTDVFQVYGSHIVGSPFAANAKADTIYLSQDTIATSFDLYGFELPKFISLTSMSFDAIGVLNLASFSFYEGEKCKLYIFSTDLSKVKLNYSQFDLDTKDMNTGQKEALYKQLLLNQDQSGYKDGFAKADVEFRQLENDKEGVYGVVVDWIQRNWNYYGYKKEKIFINALILFGLFFLINIGWYGFMVKNSYTVTPIRVAYDDLKNKSAFWRPVLYVFYGAYFTGLIFWGIKLEPDKLKLKSSPAAALWILAQYTTGIIVLAYIANIIIGK